MRKPYVLSIGKVYNLSTKEYFLYFARPIKDIFHPPKGVNYRVDCVYV